MKVILAIVILTILYIFGMSKLEVMRLSDLIMLTTSSSTRLVSSSSSSASSSSVSSPEVKIAITISGAVNKPGTYNVTPYIFLKDALTLAGGITDQADLQAFNYEYLIKENDKTIYIAFKSNQSKISINKASIEELELLPSIGVVVATNIVNYRTANGEFKILDDLLKVERIGIKTFEAIRDLIKLE
jgi:competence protein ComEA